jgi:hypothetical protein
MKTRKTSFLLGLFFLAHFCTAFANEHFALHDTEIEKFNRSIEVECGKIYITPDMVFITSHGIFVNFQGNVMPVNSISMDATGIYFLFKDYNARYDQDWKCPNRRCGWVNNADRAYCVKCNHPRPG